MDLNIHSDEALKLREVLSVIGLDHLLTVARKVNNLIEQKHGKVTLVVKNGELAFIDTTESEDVRRRNRPGRSG